MTERFDSAAIVAARGRGSVRQDIHLDEGGAITYRTKLQLSFKYEPGH